MGIFSKKPEAKPQVPVKAESTVERFVETIYLNVPEKGMRVELVSDNACMKYAEIRQSGDKIQIICSGIILAEISKKTKAYSEIEPKIGHSCTDIVIEAKTGDYGPYYRLRLRFSDTVIINN